MIFQEKGMEMNDNTCMYKSIRVLKKGVYKSVGCVSYCAEECSVCKFSCVYIAIQ